MLKTFDRHSVPFFLAALGLFLVVATVVRERHRVTVRERQRLLQLFDAARLLGFLPADRNGENWFLETVKATRLLGFSTDPRVSHCFVGTRHEVEVRFCDFSSKESSETVIAFHLPHRRPSAIRARRHGWDMEVTGEWILAYRQDERTMTDLSAFLSRAEALARPEVVQIHDLPMPFTPLPNEGLSATKVREDERRWQAFTRLKEWRAFFTRVNEMQLAGNALSPDKPVWAFTCAPVVGLTERDLNGRHLSSVDLFNSSQAGVGPVLGLLASTSYGRPVIARFLEHFRTGDIQVKQLTDHLRYSRLSRTPALFIYRPDVHSKTIYIDKTSPVGLLAPILFHEIIHSLDDEHMRAVDRQEALMTEFAQQGSDVLRDTADRLHKAMINFNPADFDTPTMEEMAEVKEPIDQMADIAIYRTEKRAADAEYLVSQELVHRHPRFYMNLKRNGKPARFQPVQVSGDDVIRRYALNRYFIEKYLKGECQSLPQ